MTRPAFKRALYVDLSIPFVLRNSPMDLTGRKTSVPFATFGVVVVLTKRETTGWFRNVRWMHKRVIKPLVSTGLTMKLSTGSTPGSTPGRSGQVSRGG
jgi:hypothetical protein